LICFISYRKLLWLGLVSAGTSSKKRRGCALGFGSKNKREEGPSEKTTSAETSSKKIRGITWLKNL